MPAVQPSEKDEATSPRGGIFVWCWIEHWIFLMRASNRSKVLGAVAGLVVCAIGVIWFLVQGPEPFGTLLTIFGAAFAGSLLASIWIYRFRS